MSGVVVVVVVMVVGVRGRGVEEGGCSAYYIPCYDREGVSAIIQ
jgi:hypothetical protein